MNFAQRLLPAKKDSGLQMPDYWVWCGSAIRAINPGEDGRYHMFASRWPRNMSQGGHWPTNSEIVRASSDTPEGPYKFEEVVFSQRDAKFFDARATHNPCIRYFGGRYYLYYIGVTYDFEMPTVDNQIEPPEADNPIGNPKAEKWRLAWESKRIGLAVADSVTGPWKRMDRPLLEPRPGKWDAMITSNPSVAIRDDGYTILIYKSRVQWQTPFHLGLAHAPNPAGPFERMLDGPAFEFDVEDPCIWWEAGRFHGIMKDFHGTVCGVPFGGIYVSSMNGRDWELGNPPLAYTRTIRWSDGISSTHGQVERASVLLDGGRATHVIFAITNQEKTFESFTQTRNIVIPLRAPGEL